MRLVIVVLSVFIAFSLLGCGSKLTISTYPGILLSEPIHTIKVFNGTNYTLEVIEARTMIKTGGQVKIHYIKGYKRRKVGISVRAIKDKQVIAIKSKEFTIPSFKGSADNTEKTWPIYRLKLIR